MRPPMITIYHNPKLPVSREALKLLKTAAAKQKFRVDLVQAKYESPTEIQVKAICGYLGKGSLAKGARLVLVPEAPLASTVEQVIETLQAKPTYLKKPLIVDWVKGRAVIADPPYIATAFVKGVGLKEDAK
ncbi:hypothetical protein BGZ65_007639 [Modicella reniformis]|uniref:Uncharacterized protein n=1 Tax=Modicella reniformis TaxID=1440133 RepID=A0A9P6MFT9_9FUNG|nr:hypothetical protein BGZ65_007639 [Modicella reniformis]